MLELSERDRERRRVELRARVEELRDKLRELEAELGVAAPSWARGDYPRGTGRLHARTVATGIGLRAAQRQLAELEREPAAV